jgi:hypothetical protein
VLRFNQAPIENYSKQVGTKTTFRLTNKVRGCTTARCPRPLASAAGHRWGVSMGGGWQVWSWRYSFSLRNGSAMHTKWATQLPREPGMVLMISRTGPELFNEIAKVAQVV